MADQGRPWITCHVLDTARGRPAADIRVVLKHDSDNARAGFEGFTNADGRVESWTPMSSNTDALDLPRLVESLKSRGRRTSQWTLEFETQSYNPTSFFDRITVNFTTDMGDKHYHVPLLLSPYGYTTYRGS